MYAVIRDAAASVVALTTLMAGCSGRDVLQSALVPYAEPAPPPTSHGEGDLYVGASGLTFFEPAGDANLGHYVPATQLHLAGSIRPRGGFTVRPLAVVALPPGAMPHDRGLLAPPTAPSVSAGLDFGYTFGSERTEYLVRPHLGVAVLGIAMMIEDPAGARAVPELAWIPIFEGGLDGGYWVTPWLLITAGLDLRNAPRVPARVGLVDGDEPPVVRLGDLALGVRVAFEFEVDHTVAFVVAASVPALGSPYAPYPTISGGVRIVFGDAPARQRFERNVGGHAIPGGRVRETPAVMPATEEVLGVLGARGG